MLIPKKSDPTKLADLRPIFLCNVVYKIMAKVLGNRLKQILPDVISENQNAFVARRYIVNSIIMAFEVSHYLKRQRTVKGVMWPLS